VFVHYVWSSYAQNRDQSCTSGTGSSLLSCTGGSRCGGQKRKDDEYLMFLAGSGRLPPKCRQSNEYQSTFVTNTLKMLVNSGNYMSSHRTTQGKNYSILSSCRMLRQN